MPSAEQMRPGPLGTDIRLALTRITRRLRAQRGDADLPEGQFGILATLSRLGPMSPGALAEHEMVKPPSMTRAVNCLADLGLVTKTDHPTDGRGIIVELSAAGVHEVSETRRRRDAWLTQQLASMTADERRILAQAAELMSRVAGK